MLTGACRKAAAVARYNIGLVAAFTTLELQPDACATQTDHMKSKRSSEAMENLQAGALVTDFCAHCAFLSREAVSIGGNSFLFHVQAAFFLLGVLIQE